MVKNRFRHRKVRYKGLKKNNARCLTLFALANPVIAKKRLLAHSFPFFTRSGNGHRPWPTLVERGHSRDPSAHPILRALRTE